MFSLAESLPLATALPNDQLVWWQQPREWDAEHAKDERQHPAYPGGAASVVGDATRPDSEWKREHTPDDQEVGHSALLTAGR